jgi:hypothetical protein
VTNRQGKRTGVVLSLKRYSRLLEDLHDLAVVAERRDKKPGTADDMKKRTAQAWPPIVSAARFLSLQATYLLRSLILRTHALTIESARLRSYAGFLIASSARGDGNSV